MNKELIIAKNKEDLPEIVDFSRRAISRSVRSRTLQHPITLYPMAVSIPTALAAALFHFPWAFSIAGVLVGLGVVSWAVNRFSRYDHFAGLCMLDLRTEMEKRNRQSIEDLKQMFEHYALAQGSDQIDDLDEKYANLKGILEKRFNEGELTFMRYLGMAEQARLVILDNLDDIAVRLKSVSTIDENEINSRLKKGGDNHALLDRLELRKKELAGIENILGKNEEFLTEIDRVATAVAEVRTVRGKATMDMESLMLELQELASRARKYSAQ